MFIKKLILIFSALSFGAYASNALAQSTPAWQIADPAELAVMCGVCHGPSMNGSIRRDGPALVGLSAEYIARQLRGYANESRGYDDRDVLGKFMERMNGMLRNEETIVAVSEYIANNYEPNPDEYDTRPRNWVWDSEYDRLDVSTGNAESGKALYATCSACHGADGTGVQAMFTDTLLHFSEAYLARQLQYFRDGIRGAHPDDTYGRMMAPMTAALSDQDIADLVTYIKTEL